MSRGVKYSALPEIPSVLQPRLSRDGERRRRVPGRYRGFVVWSHTARSAQDNGFIRTDSRNVSLCCSFLDLPVRWSSTGGKYSPAAGGSGYYAVSIRPEKRNPRSISELPLVMELKSVLNRSGNQIFLSVSRSYFHPRHDAEYPRTARMLPRGWAPGSSARNKSPPRPRVTLGIRTCSVGETVALKYVHSGCVRT